MIKASQTTNCGRIHPPPGPQPLLQPPSPPSAHAGHQGQVDRPTSLGRVACLQTSQLFWFPKQLSPRTPPDSPLRTGSRSPRYSPDSAKVPPWDPRLLGYRPNPEHPATEGVFLPQFPAQTPGRESSQQKVGVSSSPSVPPPPRLPQPRSPTLAGWRPSGLSASLLRESGQNQPLEAGRPPSSQRRRSQPGPLPRPGEADSWLQAGLLSAPLGFSVPAGPRAAQPGGGTQVGGPHFLRRGKRRQEVQRGGGLRPEVSPDTTGLGKARRAPAL